MFIIAEIGVNHNGDFTTAKKLIDAAVGAGANAVKFQSFDPVALEPPGGGREMLTRLHLSFDKLRELQKYCGERIEFLCTPFDVRSLDFLVDELEITRLKISSGGLFDDKLLRAAGKTGLPIILSTGMTTLTEIYNAHRFMKGADITLLHCNSGYPTPPEDANVSALLALKTFGCPVGLSDHTLGCVAPVLAVAYGASVIEKHFTASRKQLGPDHKASMEPAEFAKMVEMILAAEKMTGDGIKRPTASEKETIKSTAERQEWMN